MKKRHRLLALLLAVSMCMPMMTVSAYADEVTETETVVETEETVAEETETILEQEAALDEIEGETEITTEGSTNYVELTEEITEGATLQDSEENEIQDSESPAEEDEEVLLEADTEGETQSGIPEDAEEWCGHYYKVYPLTTTVDQAKEYCNSLGGYLATVNSYMECKYVESIMTSVTNCQMAVIGGKYNEESRSWNWVNDEDWYVGFGSHYSKGPYLCLWNTNSSNFAWHFVDINNDAKFSNGTIGVGYVKFFICEWGDRIDLNSMGKNGIKLSQNRFTYNGLAQKPAVSVCYKGDSKLVLAEGNEYTLHYYHNNNIGTATVEIQGIGRYCGTVKLNYYIVPSAPQNLTLSRDNAQRGVRLTWDEINNVSEYDVRWSKNKSDLSDANNAKVPVYQFTYGEDDDKAFYTGTLERGTTYYFQVRGVADRTNPNAVGEWSAIKEIKTGNQLVLDEFWGFGNNTNNIIKGLDLSYFYKVFEPQMAVEKYAEYGGTENTLATLEGGSCYGMVNSAIAAYMSASGKIFGKDSLRTIKSVKEADLAVAGNGLTAKDAIAFGHIIQDRSDYQETLVKMDLDGLLQAVKACQEGKGLPVGIGIVEGDSGHAIYGICIDDKLENEEQSVIRIYDPNEPTEEKLLFLLKNTSGVYYGWSFRGKFHSPQDPPDYMAGTITDTSEGDLIAYFTEPATKMMSDIPNAGAATFNKHEANNYLRLYFKNLESEFIKRFNDNLLVSNKVIPITRLDGDEEENNVLNYWVTDKSDLILSDVPAGTEITLSSNFNSVKIQALSKTDVTLNTSDENKGVVKVSSVENGKCDIVFSHQTTSDTPATETTITCDLKKGQEASIVKNGENDIRATGVTSIDYHSDTGSRNEYAAIEATETHNVEKDNLDAGKEYKMTEVSDEAQILSKEEGTDEFKVIEAKESEPSPGTCTHNYGNWTIVSQATCLESGKRVRYCTICGAEETEVIPKTDHTWENHYTVDVEPSADHPGKKSIHCSICDTIKEGSEEEIPVAGAQTIASGTAGDTSTWLFDSDGTLWINGTGVMNSYLNGSLVPWKDYQEKILKVVVQDGITEIGDCAFSDCPDLTEVVLPDSLIRLGGVAFQKCISLSSIDLPDNITFIGNWAFGYCSSLKHIDLPAKTEYVGNHAFLYCSALEDISIPKTLKETGELLISSGSTLFKDVYYEGSEDDWSNIQFGINNEKIQKANIHFNDNSVRRISFITDFTELALNETKQLCVKVTPSYASYGDIVWRSDDDKIISVNANGEVTGKSVGTATVYATVDNTDITCGLNLSVVAPQIIVDTKNLADASVSGIVNKTYDGKPQTQSLIVSLDGRTLNVNDDYTLIYKNNTEVGTATVIITGVGNYTGSVEKTFIITLAKPVLSSAANVNGGVKFTWKKVTGAEKYRVFRKTYNASTKKWTSWAKLADATAVNYTDKTVKSGTKYAYTVRCISADGKTYTSAYDTTGKIVTYVAAPVISSITNVNGGVKIVWPKTAGAAKYRIFRKTGSGSWAKLADTTAVNYTDKKAVNGTTYSYTIRCLNSAGKYASAYNTTGKKITYVARPTISSLTSAKTKQMTAKWGKNAKATGYQIQYSLNSKFTSGNKTVTVKGAATVSKTITNLTAKKKYYVRVRTYKAVGGKNYYSAWSAAKNVTTK